MARQISNISGFFNPSDIAVVVGFKKDLIMESFPDLLYIYNPQFDQTNTSKSLLRALKKFKNEPVLWLNGDVVFDSEILGKLTPLVDKNQSFVAVNNSEVAEEEVKYSIDKNGFIKDISKKVKPALGEAVGINFISSSDIELFIRHLEKCGDNDYFERGLETAIAEDGLRILPVDISEMRCIEVDFEEDLNNANNLFSE